MNAKQAMELIINAIGKGIGCIKLEAGETCPFCGHKKGVRKVSKKMLEANRLNIRKAIEARKANKQN